MAPTRQKLRRSWSPLLLVLALVSTVSLAAMMWKHEVQLQEGVDGFSWRPRMFRNVAQVRSTPKKQDSNDEKFPSRVTRASAARFAEETSATERGAGSAAEDRILQDARPASNVANKGNKTTGADPSLLPTTENCPASEKEREWPFYKVMEGDNGKRWPWPGVGWSGGTLSLQDENFRKDFRFYMYDSGPFDMIAAERCFKSKLKIQDDMSNIDARIPVFKRMYVAELALWSALRLHELRTRDPEHASLFIIGYSPFLAERLRSDIPECSSIPDRWEETVVSELNKSVYFQRKGGQDHMMFLMRFGIKVSPALHRLLDAGSLIVTTDRFFWGVMQAVPSAYKSGSVIVMPYVAPFHLDDPKEGDGSRPNRKDPATWYFFAGTYKRRFGARGKLAELAEHLTHVNFTDLRIPKTVAPGNGLALSSPEIVAASAAAQRRSSVCMSPQGDAITSGRLFESMAASCLPIVIAPRDKMMQELPLPSLIDWDRVALFTDNFDAISKPKDGIKTAGKVLEDLVGPYAGEREKERLECMQRNAKKVFFKHLSYFNNPSGLSSSLVFEAWILLQKRSVISGPYAAPGTTGGKGKWITWDNKDTQQ